jgi:hypothetical protein
MNFIMSTTKLHVASPGANYKALANNNAQKEMLWSDSFDIVDIDCNGDAVIRVVVERIDPLEMGNLWIRPG